MHKVGAHARRRLWLPAVYIDIHLAFRARGAAADAAAIRSLGQVGAAPTSKHGGHAHAPRATASLRDALALPATTNDTNEAQRALPPNENHLAAAVARRPSKEKGPAHVPDPRDWFRFTGALEDA